jgi:hypothetical protein
LILDEAQQKGTGKDKSECLDLSTDPDDRL